MNQNNLRNPVPDPMSRLCQEVKQNCSKLRFPVYITPDLMKASISELDLSVRSLNCLRRSEYQTIGQLVQAISCSEDLKRIRNCGKKTVSEIMSSLFFYQYSRLSAEQQNQYLQRVLALSSLSDWEAALLRTGKEGENR